MVAMKKNPFFRARRFFATGAVCAAFLSVAYVKAVEEAKETTVLETGSRWRCLHVWGAELVRWETGEVTAVQPGKKGAPPIEKKAEKAPLSTNVQADWAGTDFNDSTWVPTTGPFRHAENLRDLAALYLRGKFEVSNPEAVGELTLSLTYRGGVAAYLNGKEICRQHLPEGPLTPDTPAEAYATEAYLDKEGLVISVERGKASSPEGVQARARSLDGIKIPASALRQGINVLAVELRRAPTAECFFTKRPPKGANMDWTHLVLEGLKLTVAGAGVEPEAGRAGKPRLWTDNILSDLWACDAALVGEENRPLNVVGARNGAFSGVLGVRAAETIKHLSVEPGELKLADGSAVLPAANVRVRYAVAGDPPTLIETQRRPKGANFLGVLMEAPPKEVPLPAGAAGVTQPVWLTVKVPADAKPGTYQGVVGVRVNEATFNVPLILTVADFSLPNVSDFVSCADMP
jgi:hypothetical protein